MAKTKERYVTGCPAEHGRPDKTRYCFFSGKVCKYEDDRNRCGDYRILRSKNMLRQKLAGMSVE